MTRDEYRVECLKRNPEFRRDYLDYKARWGNGPRSPDKDEVEAWVKATKMMRLKHPLWSWGADGFQPRVKAFDLPGPDGRVEIYIVADAEATEEEIVNAWKEARTVCGLPVRGKRVRDDKRAFSLQVFDAVQCYRSYARAAVVLGKPEATVRRAFNRACRDIGVPPVLPSRATATPSGESLHAHLAECVTCQRARGSYCHKMRALLNDIAPDSPRREYVTVADPEARRQPTTSKKPHTG